MKSHLIIFKIFLLIIMRFDHFPFKKSNSISSMTVESKKIKSDIYGNKIFRYENNQEDLNKELIFKGTVSLINDHYNMKINNNFNLQKYKFQDLPDKISINYQQEMNKHPKKIFLKDNFLIKPSILTNELLSVNNDLFKNFIKKKVLVKFKKAKISSNLENFNLNKLDNNIFFGEEYKNSKMINEIAFNSNFDLNIPYKKMVNSTKRDLVNKTKKFIHSNSNNFTSYNQILKNQENLQRNSTIIKNGLINTKKKIKEKMKYLNWKKNKTWKNITNKNNIKVLKRSKINDKKGKKKFKKIQIKKKFANNSDYKPEINFPNEKNYKIKKEKTAIDYFIYKDHSFTITSCEDAYLGAFVRLLNYPDKSCQNKFLKFYLNDRYFSIANEFDSEKYIEILFINRIKIPEETYNNCFSISYAEKNFFLDMCFETKEIAEDILKSIKFLSLCKHPKRAENYLKQQENIRNCYIKHKFMKFE